MEQTEVEKGCIASEDTALSRNRSFKSKQLVRSQAIRESTSPPRTVSPYVLNKDVITNNEVNDNINSDRTDTSDSSHSDRCSVINNDRCGDKKLPVEIQITTGGWEADAQSEQRLRTRRWLGHRHHSDSSRDLLSYNPRVACVCGTCACPHCRGRPRKQACPTKQDSGIVCSDDCPDCSDNEHAGPNGDGTRKSGSFDADDQTFYCRCPERKEKPKSLSLSGIDAEEPTGPELVNFIKDTLNKNPRDRITLLKIEKELHSLVNDTGRCIVRFPVMTSYGRMLVHRCASLFQLAHHLDHSNKNSVLVSKSGTSGGRIPCTSFRQWCTATFPRSPPRRHDDMLAKSILKRCDGGAGAMPAATAGRSKSLEQREREYERVRRRIFSTDNCTQDESQWPWLTSGPIKLLTPEAGRNKLLKVHSLESRGGPEGNVRGPVSKSHSFGGYTGEPPQQRMLSKQGDQALSSWRLSPSSSGYKTLSLRSTDSVTPSPSPTGGVSPEPGIEAATLVWAVTDMSAVPPGALVLHPQTGCPLTNPDGSLYHFDPNNPPLLYNSSGYMHGEPKHDPNIEKRRGKLEKQHSFMDNECECQPSEECRIKCCCECRRHEYCQSSSLSDKNSPQKTTKSTSNPNSPAKVRLEPSKPTEPETKPEPENQDQSETKYNEIVHKSNGELKNYDSTHDNAKDTQQPIDNQRNFEVLNSTTQSIPRSFDSSNQRAPYEMRVLENTNQRVYENQRFDNTFDGQNQKVVVNMPEEVLQQNYIQGFRNEDIISPQAMMNYPPPDIAEMQSMMQAKVTPIPAPDPNLRPMSLTNMVYPAGVPQPNVYPYVNPYRIEQPMQAAQIYQPMVQPEEQKQITTLPHNENTFRIDPSYPYAADFSAACGACDPVTMQQTRGYNVPYGQMEVPPGVMQPYAVPNMLIQPPMQPYPYQEQVPLQWQSIQPPAVTTPAAPKVMLHDLYPLVYPNVYQPYNIVYPQVMPQPYPLVQQMYPLVDKQPEIRRNSLPRPKRNLSRATPHAPFEEKRYDETRKDERQNEIAMKIQQIKEQMAQLNTKDRGRNEWRRRNSGSGILGCYPVNFNGRVIGRPQSDNTQLSTAARAIVNSIRSIQAKNNYQHDNRRFEQRGDRPDFRNRGFRPDRNDHVQDGERDERRDRRLHPSPLFRPQYMFRQMSPGTWCRRSPGPVPQAFNQPRRPHPDPRNGRH